jgi:hypothetical protein
MPGSLADKANLVYEQFDVSGAYVIFSRLMKQFLLRTSFRSSHLYWEKRYKWRLTSGAGSYGKLAAFKAEVINEFVREHTIGSVAEFGCGDGNQLSLANFPAYLGIDVSKTAIDVCRTRFRHDATKSFVWKDPGGATRLDDSIKADLTLSLDVVYHLVEDDVYDRYLSDLFDSSLRYVIVYSSNFEDENTPNHVRHRHFTRDVTMRYPQFRLIAQRDNRFPELSFCQFFFFEKSN